MKPQGSNLVTAAGLILLLIAAIAAAWFRITGLLVFLAGILLLCLIAWLWAGSALSRITVSPEETEYFAFPGETISAAATLENAKFLPVIWLEAGFDLKENGCTAPLFPDGERPTVAAQSFLWVMPKQTLHWELEAKAAHRGTLRVDSMDLLSGDGFGLSSRRKEAKLTVPFRFVVYPALFPVKTGPIVGALRELERSHQGLYTDPTLINSIRPYQPGDNIRDINWRLLARQQSLQVNVREKESMRRVCFLPDLASFSYKKVKENSGTGEYVICVHQKALERTLSLIASLTEALSHRDILCSLILPGTEKEEGQVLIPETAEGQVMPVFTALAELDYTGQELNLPWEAILQARHRTGRIFVFSCKASDLADEVSRHLDDLPVYRVLRQAGSDPVPLDNTLYESELIEQ